MQKLKAYTLIEVIVTLLLSVIIIGAAITGYSLINEQFRIFDISTKQSLDILQFNAMMKTDIDRCEAIFYENEQLVLKQKNNVIIYRFEENKVFRNEQSVAYEEEINSKEIDLNIIKVETYFEGEIQYFGIIDRFTLQINNFGEPRILPYSKKYSAVQLMNFKNNNQ